MLERGEKFTGDVIATGGKLVARLNMLHLSAMRCNL